MLVGQFRHLTSTRSATDEAFFDKERLVHLLHRTGIFANGGGNGGHAHRSTLKLIDDGGKNFVVNLVQPIAVDIERFEGITGNLQIDRSVAFDLRKVAHAAQQGVSNTWCATAAAGNLGRSLRVDTHRQKVGRAQHDFAQRLRVVVFQVEVDAEARPQRCGEQTATRGGAHQGEGVEIDLDGARRRPFVDHNVDTVVLHRRVEIFLHNGGKAVNFVDEKHIVRFERSEQPCQIAGLVEHRTGGELEAHPEFVGNDIGEGCLSQAGRAVEEGVIERFTTLFGRFDKDTEVVHHLRLPRKVVKRKGA